MDDKDIQFLRKKHNNSRNTKFDYCDLCGTRFPCDTIKVLEELEQVERQSAMNYELGYEFGYRDANKKWTDKL